MLRPSAGRTRERGQVLALFALSATVLIMGMGLVVDGGGALVERRESQNTSDFAALAGARIVAQWIDESNEGTVVHGVDANVRAAINASVDASGGTPITYGAPSGPYYVNERGANVGYVGTGVIPGCHGSNCTGTQSPTVGVTVPTSRSYRPYLLGVIGVTSWTASSTATARGGYADGAPVGAIFPAAISLAFFETYPRCGGTLGSSPECLPVRLTPGNLNVPGGFGWLKFGAVGQCEGFGLGMSKTAGCREDIPFLQEELGPPAKSYGCCTELSGDPDLDRIGSIPGNKAAADCDHYIRNEEVVTVPIWDYAGGTGSNGWYHITGFAGFQITGCEDGKNLSGVWRKKFFLGPTTATGGREFSSLAVQLIR
jgi:Flp pilus assembly protein TadG